MALLRFRFFLSPVRVVIGSGERDLPNYKDSFKSYLAFLYLPHSRSLLNAWITSYIQGDTGASRPLLFIDLVIGDRSSNRGYTSTSTTVFVKLRKSNITMPPGNNL